MKQLMRYCIAVCCLILTLIPPAFARDQVSTVNRPIQATGEISPSDDDIFRSTEPGLDTGEDPFGSTEPGLSKPELVVAPGQTGNSSSRAGGGIVIFSYFAGFSVFYDFIPDRQSGNLLHSRFAMDFTTTAGEGSDLSINRNLLSIDYRISLSNLKGAYGGLGLGYGQSSLSYTNNNTNASYSASGGGLFALVNTGWIKTWKWQSHRQIFLDLGFYLGSYILYEEDYDETRISNETNHRDIVNTGWEASQQLMQISLSFGGTF